MRVSWSDLLSASVSVGDGASAGRVLVVSTIREDLAHPTVGAYEEVLVTRDAIRVYLRRDGRACRAYTAQVLPEAPPDGA